MAVAGYYFGNMRGYGSNSESGPVETPESQWGRTLSQMLAGIAQGVFDWAQGMSAKGMAMTEANMANFFRLSGESEGLAKQLISQYNDTFAPAMEQYARDAATYDNPKRMAYQMGRAGSLAEQGVKSALDSAERALQAHGVNPDSGRSMALQYAMKTAGAANVVGAENEMANAVQNRAMQMRSDVAHMGLQFPAMATNALQTSIAGYNAASQALIGAMNASANLMGAGAGWANAAANANKSPGQQSKSSSRTPPGGGGGAHPSKEPKEEKPPNEGQQRPPPAGTPQGKPGSPNPDHKPESAFAKPREDKPGGEAAPIGTIYDDPTQGTGSNLANYPGMEGMGLGLGLPDTPFGEPSALGFQPPEGMPQSPWGNNPDAYTPDAWNSRTGYDPNPFNFPQGPQQSPWDENAGWDNTSAVQPTAGGYDTPTDTGVGFDGSNPWDSAQNWPTDAGQDNTGWDPYGQDNPWDAGGDGWDPYSQDNTQDNPWDQWNQDNTDYTDWDAQDNTQDNPWDQWNQDNTDYTDWDAQDNTQDNPWDQWNQDNTDYTDYGGGDSYDSGSGDYARGGPVRPTTGGPVPARASPSRGRQVDDVPARLNVDEFVIPRDVHLDKGTAFFNKLIAQSRKARTGMAGPPTGAKMKPSLRLRPTFQSRPMGG